MNNSRKNLLRISVAIAGLMVLYPPTTFNKHAFLWERWVPNSIAYDNLIIQLAVLAIVTFIIWTFLDHKNEVGDKSSVTKKQPKTSSPYREKGVEGYKEPFADNIIGTIKLYWEGKKPLWKSFWIYSVLVGNIYFFAVLTLIDEDLLVGVLLLLYLIWNQVSIWRCATNTTYMVWTILARALVIIVMLNIFIPILYNFVIKLV